MAAGTFRGTLPIGNREGLFRARPVEDSRAFPEIGMYRPEAELEDYGSNEALLKQVAQFTGGRFEPSPSAVFEPGPRSIETTLQLWPGLLGLAVLLGLVELVMRKWKGMHRQGVMPDADRNCTARKRRIWTKPGESAISPSARSSSCADPSKTLGDRDMLGPRFRSGCAELLGARAGERLIGSVVATRWGSFGFFGPLTVLPEYWDQGVAKSLLEETMRVFERWGLRHSGLFTFPHSAKHVGLYQKFGYWPQYLTAVMKKTPEPGPPPALFSALDPAARQMVLSNARELTHGISPGLDLTGEILSATETVLVEDSGALDAFAVCHTGAGSEGGSGVCYIKFGAARSAEDFEALLAACESFAAQNGAMVEAGVNLAREDAYRRLRARGYRTVTQGVAMQRPHEVEFNRPGVYVIDDWR